MAELAMAAGTLVVGLTAFFLNGEQAEEWFTQARVQLELSNNPYKNVMVCHSQQAVSFVNSTHQHVEMGLTSLQTKGYEVYVFDSGFFQLQGDGGFRNWCFGKNFVRDPSDGSKVTFYPIAQPAPPPPPPQTQVPFEGIFLVNASNSGGDSKTGVAWYRNAWQAEGHSPDPPLEAAGVGRSWTPWEGSTQSVTFNDGNVFTWDINANAQSEPDYTLVGTSKNNFRKFDVFKDNKRVLYTQNGWTFTTIYYCK